jgi:hypothetical protein
MAVSIIQNYGDNNNPANAPFSGPLASLYNNRYAFNALQYPRDLGSSYKGHIVKFDMMETVPVTTLSGLKDYVVKKGEAVVGAATEVFKQTANENTVEKLQFRQQASEIKDSISLYMPDSVEFSYASNYNTMDLSSAGAVLGNIAGAVPLIGGIAKAVTSGAQAVAGDNPLIKLGLNAAGYVFNPQQQLLFQGIDFREYQMSFVFTPTSAQEAQNIKNIIKTFRRYAAPVIVNGAAGFFFNPPGMVDVSFLYNGSKNPNLNQIKRSVIKNIDVNYAPNGWAAHEDGAPVQTTLTMSFQEMVLVDRAQIDNGY